MNLFLGVSLFNVLASLVLGATTNGGINRQAKVSTNALLSTEPTVVRRAASSRSTLEPSEVSPAQAHDHHRIRECIDVYATGLHEVHRGLGRGVRAIDKALAEGVRAPQVSNRSDIVFGAGSGTTGTRSFLSVMKLLGLNGWHFRVPGNDTVRGAWKHKIWTILDSDVPKCRADLAAFDHVAHHPDSLEFIMDTPVSELFIHLFLAYPKAKYFLSTRPGEAWAKSRHTNHRGSFAPLQDPCKQHVYHFLPKNLAKMQILKDELVRCVVPKSQLFEVDLWTDGDERMQHLVSDLAEFVGRPIANKDQPMPGSSFKVVGPKYGGDEEEENVVDPIENSASCPNCNFPEDRMYSHQEISRLIYHNAKFDREVEFSGS